MALILVDMDGVIADLDTGFYDEWSASPHNDEMPAIPRGELTAFFPKTDYVTRFATSAAGFVDSERKTEIEQSVNDIVYAQGFVRNLPLIPNAQKGIERLLRADYTLAIVSSPFGPKEQCEEEKREYLAEHFESDTFKGGIYFESDKGLITGEFLIDDNNNDLNQKFPHADWKHVLFNRLPYNKFSTVEPRMSWNYADFEKLFEK